MFARIGTKPVDHRRRFDRGAAGLYWLSRIPVDGSYVSDILPGILVFSVGLGGVFTGATTAANAGVGEDQAGLAAGLLNTGQQFGTALGLAILSARRHRTHHSLLHAGHDTVAQAATHGYQRALLAGAVLVLAATLVASLAPNRRESKPDDRGRAGARPRGLERGSRAPLPACGSQIT